MILVLSSSPHGVSNAESSLSAADEPGSETAGLDSACKPSAKRKRTGRNTSPHTEDSDKEETSKDDIPVVSKKARKVGQRRSARR